MNSLALFCTELSVRMDSVLSKVNDFQKPKEHLYKIILYSGQEVLLGNYSKIINGESVFCIDKPINISSIKNMIFIEQKRFFDGGDVRNRSISVPTSSIKCIIASDGSVAYARNQF